MKIVPDLCNQRLKVEREPDPNEPGKNEETWWDRQQARNRAWLARILAVVFVVLLAWSAFQQSVKLKNIASGPAAPWSQQLAAVQGAIEKVDKNYAITAINAERDWNSGRDYSTNSISDTLAIRFEFITPHRRGLEVTLKDTDPGGTVTKPSEGMYWDTPLDELERLRKKVAGVLITPRDALEVTLPEIRALPGYNEKMGTQPIIGLVYREANPGPLNSLGKMPGDKPVLWRVNYFLPYAGFNEISFWVDPATGQIQGKDVAYPGVPTLVPSTTTPTSATTP